jgi:gas vesicle protein
MKTSNVILGILAGAAVGAVVGILFAPDSGKNTRDKISRKTGDLVGDLKDRADHLADRASQLAHKATSLVDKVSDSMHKAKREEEAMADKSRSKYTEMQN